MDGDCRDASLANNRSYDCDQGLSEGEVKVELIFTEKPTSIQWNQSKFDASKMIYELKNTPQINNTIPKIIIFAFIFWEIREENLI